MHFKLHNVKSDDEGFLHLARFAEATNDISNETIKLDLSLCRHFDANMAAPLATILCRVTDKQNTIEIVRAPWKVEEILRKNQFLKDYGYSTLADNNHTTLPFVHIELSNTQSFADYLSEHMNGKGIPQMSAALEKAFRQSIFEVFENCVSHSHSKLGVFVCGQFYPYYERLDLTISDAGIGIRTNVRRHLRDNKISSVDAIKWALIEGHTTKTGNQPGGMGLKLLKDFIEINGGKIQITSRQGFYQFTGGTEKVIKLASDLPGTTVNLEINTNDKHSYRLGSETTSNNIF